MISPHSPYSINHSPHPTHLTSTHLYSSLTSFTSSHLIYLNHLTSSHLTSPHLTTPNLTYLATSHLTSNLLCSSHSPNLTSSPHLTLVTSSHPSHLTLSHITSPHLTSPHSTSPRWSSSHSPYWHQNCHSMLERRNVDRNMMREWICLAQKRKILLGRVKQELRWILHKAGSENFY